MPKKIVMTGGGTAGHVTPNIALMPKLMEKGYEISYIGSYEGIEKGLISEIEVPYYSIATGKLRRYFDPQNFTDPFRVIKGYFQAKKILKKIRPEVVFSKGGFVSVPVVRAAASLKIPCIIHESDMTPGLANRLCIPRAKVVCCNFPETLQRLPSGKAVLTGSPIREELLEGDKKRGLEFCGFTDEKPVILVMGGSQGAAAINKNIRGALAKLLPDFNIVHLCGKEKMDNLLLTTEGYKQYEYINEQMKDLLAMADLVVSRAGANSICELLTLRKPNILIPLSPAASRGDQILNAQSFESQGFSVVIDEDYLTPGLLAEKIHELFFTRQTYVENMEKSNQGSAVDTIISLIEKETATEI